jgi:NADH:ubiquinone oxidoreductase subunit
MQIIDRIITKIFMTEIGKDDLGNRYFQSSSKDYLERPKRVVLYKGMAEPTKISSNWYSWIHYLTDTIPLKEYNLYNWEKRRQPNFTGTKSSDIKRRWIKKDIYIRWKPK